jgi:hypothetical protein
LGDDQPEAPGDARRFPLKREPHRGTRRFEFALGAFCFCRMTSRPHATLPRDDDDVGVRQPVEFKDRASDHGLGVAEQDAFTIGAEESPGGRGFETVRGDLLNSIEAAHRRHRPIETHGASANRLVLRSGYVRRSRGDWFGRSACPGRPDTPASAASGPTAGSSARGTTGSTRRPGTRRTTWPLTLGSPRRIASETRGHHGTSQTARRYARRQAPSGQPFLPTD